MYKISYTNQFKKDLKKCQKRGMDMMLIQFVIQLLAQNGKLPATYKPHLLSGNKDGIWECHIKSDWLLLWRQNNKELTLLMLETGTHSDVFGK